MPAAILNPLRTELDDTKSCYQLITSITKFEKEKGENVPEKEYTTVLVAKYEKKTLIQVQLIH